MSVAVAVTQVDQTTHHFIVYANLTLTGNYGEAAGDGDIVDFTGIDAIKASQPPDWSEIKDGQAAGNTPYGYSYNFAPGTSLANGKLQVMNQVTAAAKTGAVQFTEGDAYSTGTPSLNNAVLKARFWFRKFI